ncbi:MAG: substrate-binding domain-containing protein [Collinsella sp.]
MEYRRRRLRHRHQIAARPADERPDFVVGLTDVLASGVISALVDKGIAVPGQVRVAGCDGNPLAWSGSVPLTTVAPRLRDWPQGRSIAHGANREQGPAKTKHIRVGSQRAPSPQSPPPRTSTAKNWYVRSCWNAPAPRQAARPTPRPSTSVRIYSTPASMLSRRSSKRGPTIAGPFCLSANVAIARFNAAIV